MSAVEMACSDNAAYLQWSMFDITMT